MSEVKSSHDDVLRDAEAIFTKELRRVTRYDLVFQGFVLYLPVNSVGVVGDARRYGYVIVLFAAETFDFVRARWPRLPIELIEHVSNRIINENATVFRSEAT